MSGPEAITESLELRLTSTIYPEVAKAILLTTVRGVRASVEYMRTPSSPSSSRTAADILTSTSLSFTFSRRVWPVSYTHLRAHETDSYLVCRLLLEKKKKK